MPRLLYLQYPIDRRLDDGRKRQFFILSGLEL
jgi:hypothetical protein